MGKTLQIRVSAQTYDPAEVGRRWPRLSALVWPENAPEATVRGVLELVAELADGLAFKDWPEAVKNDLSGGVRRAESLKDRLEAALADWKPGDANRLSDELEDALDGLEKAAPKP